ncbi:Aste57867_12307 [Aphanomyces stellatus]|uniref:Aste57867_12307 protein n=1 Tax=Aphanomyces stellatus TaxID=120398 RepID=A0A485KV72_9STRA|nr:hypothetical protein As57867_012261 [Aphanomyces stellatus]VFT89159.1 Aste57867_12307 [Aphanomyces stellatus]
MHMKAGLASLSLSLVVSIASIGLSYPLGSIYTPNNFFWIGNNASGPASFVADILNAALWNTTTAISVFGVTSVKNYSTTETSIPIQATYARRLIMQLLEYIHAAVPSRPHARTKSMLLCWLDFDRQWKTAKTGATPSTRTPPCTWSLLYATLTLVKGL